MGPIDFTKFSSVKNEYLASYDLSEISSKLKKLEAKFPLYKSYMFFINDEKKLENIINADNIELQKLKTQLDLSAVKFEYYKCSSPKKVKTAKRICRKCSECKENEKKRKFHSELMDILDYANNGKKYLRQVYSKIGIKTCYICNAQYALAIDPDASSTLIKASEQKRHAAKFQFDHYYPKDKYPILSISLYNLLPICSSCNSIKGGREIGIDFFSNDPNHWDDKFTFNIIERSLTSFLLNQKDLEIDFIDKYLYPKGMDPLSDRYDIKGIYNTQIDMIEELIIRKIKYSNTYKGKLNSSFPMLFNAINIDDRIELGTYTKKEDMHKRPMTKLLQDIDKQLSDYFQQEISKIRS